MNFIVPGAQIQSIFPFELLIGKIKRAPRVGGLVKGRAEGKGSGVVSLGLKC